MAIINENQLKTEIRRIVGSELKKLENEMETLWKHLQKVYDKLNIIETKWLKK